MKNNISLFLVVAIILSGVCLAFAPAPSAKAPAANTSSSHTTSE